MTPWSGQVTRASQRRREDSIVDDVQAMERCLVLARESLERGDHSVGSVVLQNGELIGEGNNRQVTDLDLSALDAQTSAEAA